MKKYDTKMNYMGTAKGQPMLGPIAGNIVMALKKHPKNKYKDYRWRKAL